ncbi:MAG: beta-aspartyl-peptidase [Halieaceae bacterium]|jgi:beta-aspartyl-dipeptidase (metallo-type)|nr:beta-aspartyl-peptidase [Halieaceae bacterium]
MLTLINNAQVYSPQHIGTASVLISGGRILAVGDVELSGRELEVVDAQGRWLLPGFVDALTHPCGGGGEGGFGNRTPEISAGEFVRAGVTCPVGALGTDSLARSLDVLYGCVMGLRERGLAAHMYTGAYRVPAPTLTGDIARDLVLVAPVIGVGEVAVSDHRSSMPTAEELRRLAADSRQGGILSGKTGTVLVHVGDGDSRLAPLRDALAGSDLPAHSFYPTHVNRSGALIDEAAALASNGAWVDITVSTTPELIAAGDIPGLEALKRLLAAGAPADRVTMSSDAGGSLPLFENGELRGLTAASPASMLEMLQQAMREAPEAVGTVIAALSVNPAAALGLNTKGRIEVGSDADLLLLDPDGGQLSDVMCGGAWLLRAGELVDSRFP